jgi:hypothetical protein
MCSVPEPLAGYGFELDRGYHLMGESKLKRLHAEEMLLSCAGVQTAGGRVQVRWETDSAATPMGQLAYFIEFLTLTGLWSGWQDRCPLSYTSPNAPSKVDVLGTWMRSILSGHRRYSHVTTIRCDGVNPGLLGMNKVISEDTLRRAPVAIPEEAGVGWLDGHLRESTAPLLDVPWILDIDTTIKPLYGKQDGAVVSYNPKKPGQPSHSYHTYLMAELCLVMGVEGNEHAGATRFRTCSGCSMHCPRSTNRRWCAAIAVSGRTASCASSKRGRSLTCSSCASRRTSNATSSACSGSRAGRTRARAGKASTARRRSPAGRARATWSCCVER